MGNDLHLLAQSTGDMLLDAHRPHQLIKIKQHSLLSVRVGTNFIRQFERHLYEFAEVSLGVDVRTVAGANHLLESLQIDTKHEMQMRHREEMLDDLEHLQGVIRPTAVQLVNDDDRGKL